jgi:hypothetical protein
MAEHLDCCFEFVGLIGKINKFLTVFFLFYILLIILVCKIPNWLIAFLAFWVFPQVDVRVGLAKKKHPRVLLRVGADIWANLDSPNQQAI